MYIFFLKTIFLISNFHVFLSCLYLYLLIVIINTT